MFICGSRSFGHEDEDDCIKSTYPISKRSRRSLSFGNKNVGRDNQSKNPYAERGLDKFYALLAELDEKKQKIYSELGSEDIAFVRFVYSHDSDRVRPIIVRVKDNKKQAEKNIQELIKNRITSNAEKSDNKSPKVITSHEETVAKDGSNERKLKKETSLRRINTGFKVIENLRKPYYYMAIYVMLVLLLLAIYGRAFAILCTSIGWYTVPTIVERTSSSSTSSKRKKEYVRKQSDKKVLLTSEGPSSPKSVINGLS